MTRNRLSAFLLYLLVVSSCANQSQPTGGPKDEDPPVLESSDPSPQSVNVTTNKIELTFDEYVKVNNPKEQLIITPRVDFDYDMKYRKNKIIITFEEDLPDSTTFTFNFREAIQDITESNAPENLNLAFSTGSYLDSMKLTGTVYHLLEGKVAENITIALYEISDTLNIFTGPPLYFTKTDKEGNYTLSNIKIGTYRLYGFMDNNKNLTAESKSEKYAFLQDTVQLDTILTDLRLDLVQLDARPLEMQSARQSGTTYNIKYNKYVTDYNLISSDTTLIIESSFSDVSHNNIRIYNTFPIADSLQIFVFATDSIYNTTTDTLYIKYEETQRKPVELEQQLEVQPVIFEERLLSGKLKFNKPISSVNYDSTYIYIDSTHVYPIDSTLLTWNKYGDELFFDYLLDKTLFQEKPQDESQANQINNAPKPTPADSLATDTTKTATPPKPELKPHVRFAKNSFISAEYDSSSNIYSELAFTKADQLGTIVIAIETEEKSYFVQLLDNQNNVVQEVNSLREFQFKHIPPGTYRIRILIDSNNDGLWSPGNINLNRPPEPVIYYVSSTDQQEITIRANFELVPDPITF